MHRIHPTRRTNATNRIRTRRRMLGIAGAALSLGLLATACGSDTKASSREDRPSATTEHEHPDEPAESPRTAAAGTPASTEVPVTVPASSGAIQSIDTAQSGSIQIVAQGSLRDPEVGTTYGVGVGSGFFIDSNGLAVTNNHVVTGAATLEVYVAGDLSTSYNAQVLGVSECNDLALIQVGTTADVPYFDWFQGEVTPGIDVYAAGFPLGDPQFTLTKGIVAKARAGGDLTGTSSIDHTIEHDASIQPGNSGGPLLKSDGTVVGVNYAGGQRDIGAQYYAISSDLAQDVVERLRDGDFESLGINGNAVVDEVSGLAGIWVGGVAPGSPASAAGVLPGDIVTSMNGLPVGTDGTFKDYCDVIRTAGDRPIAIEVLRFDTQEVLRGEINGDQVLTPAFSFAEEVEEGGTEMEPATSTYTTYVPVVDDTGTLTLEVPAEWVDTLTTPIDDGSGNAFPRIEASTDLEAFGTTYGAPGVQFAALPAASYDVDTVLAQFAQADSCTDGGIADYDDGAFVGKYQVWQDCGGTGTIFVVLATNAVQGGAYTYLTDVQAVSSADLDALDHILATFNAAS